MIVGPNKFSFDPAQPPSPPPPPPPPSTNTKAQEIDFGVEVVAATTGASVATSVLAGTSSAETATTFPYPVVAPVVSKLDGFRSFPCYPRSEKVVEFHYTVESEYLRKKYKIITYK
ncbi:hypothetical protein RUM43_006469 [Polyplax serrata]|uniref:Uncharacterized protein n=1 Tax=Polyplax serrata TaxID=468196 RepID=A0AAN8NTD3_POLSC